MGNPVPGGGLGVQAIIREGEAIATECLKSRKGE